MTPMTAGAASRRIPNLLVERFGLDPDAAMGLMRGGAS